MVILSEQSLVDCIHKLAKKAKNRIWVASPYIGSLGAVSSILNAPWTKPLLNLRLLTDIEECSKESHATLEKFFRGGQISTLKGLHAKIYIFDDEVVVTSANLTETAFSKRFEVGVLLSASDAANAIATFDTWWRKDEAKQITKKDIASVANRKGFQSTTDSGSSLKKRWMLPKAKAAKNSGSGQSITLDYNYFMSSYQELADAYRAQSKSRIRRNLNFEIDALLDYLFHHGQCPSKQYEMRQGIKPAPRLVRNLDSDIAIHLPGFNEWIKKDKGNEWRTDRHNTITTFLNKKSISKLTYTSLREIADCLNCMNSYAINKTRFCNPANNSIETVKDTLFDLIHGKEDVVDRIRSSISRLKYFGPASAQELLGFYFPDKYPLRNGNSNAGLRYFGFDVDG